MGRFVPDRAPRIIDCGASASRPFGLTAHALVPGQAHRDLVLSANPDNCFLAWGVEEGWRMMWGGVDGGVDV